MTDQRADAQTTYEHEIAELRQELATLRAEDEAKTLSHQQELESLRAEFAALRATIISAAQQSREADGTPASDVATGLNTPTVETGDNEPQAATTASSRRTLLKWGGLGAAAALAAAGGSALTSQTAHAADGTNLILGQTSTAEHLTILTYNGTETVPHVFAIDAAAHTDSTGLSVTVGNASGNFGAQTTGIISTAGTGPDTYGIHSTAGDGAVGIFGFGGSIGVWGSSSSGSGLAGSSDTGVDIKAEGTGRIYQRPTTFVGPPTSGVYSMGEQIRDINNDLFICVWDGYGAPPGGAWKKVAALDTHYNGGAIGFLTTPIRVYDSRKTGGPLVGNATRTVQVANVTIGGVKVPAGATGCIGNLTVTGATASGYVVIYPAGSPTPSSSTVNFQSGQTVANAFAVGLNSSGQVTIHSFTSGRVQFIVDITGFVA